MTEIHKKLALYHQVPQLVDVMARIQILKIIIKHNQTIVQILSIIKKMITCQVYSRTKIIKIIRNYKKILIGII
jgi:hypothetical protein